MESIITPDDLRNILSKTKKISDEILSEGIDEFLSKIFPDDKDHHRKYLASKIVTCRFPYLCKRVSGILCLDPDIIPHRDNMILVEYVKVADKDHAKLRRIVTYANILRNDMCIIDLADVMGLEYTGDNISRIKEFWNIMLESPIEDWLLKQSEEFFKKLLIWIESKITVYE